MALTKWIALAVLAAYVASIYTTNWLVTHVGTTCIPDGPCLIPVGFGYEAPSGVLMVGIALVLRDVVQERWGRAVTLGAILAGAGLSAMLSPALALASGTAFLVSELADFAIYTPLRRRNRPLAVALSGTVGGVVDSALFLWLAFGSLAFIEGQIVGKTEMALLGALIIMLARRWRVAAA